MSCVVFQFPPCCWITYHSVMNLPIIPVAAVVQLQHLCPFSDLLWVAQLLKSYHALPMAVLTVMGFSLSSSPPSGSLKSCGCSSSRKVNIRTFTPLGIATKQNYCWGWVMRNSIACKDIVLVVACYHLLVDTRHCDHIICALDQDEIQKQIAFQHSILKHPGFL